jgi:adenylate cyclase
VLAAILGAACALLASSHHAVHDIERRTYDLRVRWHTPAEKPSAPITIIAVDDESLARLEPAVGRWPWPRALFATVLDYASAASVIGLDILFPESDSTFPASDDALAEQVAAHGRVVAATFFDQQAQGWIEPYEPLRARVAAWATFM